MGYTAQVLDAAPAEVQTGLRRLAHTFSHFAFLETGRALGAFCEPLDRYSWLAAGGCKRLHRMHEADAEGWTAFCAAWRAKPTWLFGVLGYELKNVLEPTALSRHAKAEEDTPDLEFFEPEWVVTCQGNELTLHFAQDTQNAAQWWYGMQQKRTSDVAPSFDKKGPTLRAAWQASDYEAHAQTLLDHCYRGDLYEVNLCARWKAKAVVDPMGVYRALQERTDAPMAGVYHSPSGWLLSGSPERYLTIRKEGDKRRVYSQPIKGTASIELPANALRQSEKECAENTMIVDLVRNDLSRVAIKGSVTVPRYLEVRTLPTVHHMVSTVCADLTPEADWLSAVQASFPMGSMTRAPKIRAMQRIDEEETARRGWYSGALGYVQPNGECDFNVVIRSLIHHGQTWHGWAGSALTVLADPKAEWEELQLKMKAPIAALENPWEA